MSENHNSSETGIVVAPAIAIKDNEQPTPEKTPPHREQKPAARGSSLFSVLLNLLILIAVAALGYGFWQQKIQLESVSAQYAALADQVTGAPFTDLQEYQQQTTGRLQQIEAALDTIEQQVERVVTQQQQSEQQEQSQLQTQLAESASRIVNLTGQLNVVNGEVAAMRQQLNQPVTWTADMVMLQEAAALVELAQQRLLAARDVNSAATLLRGSDDLLSRITSVDVAAARTTLAANLTDLQSLPVVDAAALYQEIADMSFQVSAMPVVSGSYNDEFSVPQPDEAVQEAPDSGWLDDALSVLGEFFVVTRQDVEVAPLLSEAQQFWLRQNIELQLASAQLALLNAEPDVYQAALTAAQEGIDKWLQGTDDAKLTMLATLDRLREAPVVVEIADISAALAAIREAAAPSIASPAAEAVQ